MQIWLCFLLAGTASAAPAAEHRTNTNGGPELLRRAHLGKQQRPKDGEQPVRATTAAAYSLTEQQMVAAKRIGSAIARQPKHHQERMIKVLQQTKELAEARIAEEMAMDPDPKGHHGSASLVEEEAFHRRDAPLVDDDGELDTVPQWKIAPIGKSTPESLAEASAGWQPPPNWKRAVTPHMRRASVQEQVDKEKKEWRQQHPSAHPNGLSEYWLNAEKAEMNHTRGKKPGYITEADPELPPELSAFEKDNYEGNTALSEYFGPFRLDYMHHTIDCHGWNFVVSSPKEQRGLGNVMIGEDNFVSDATNSFVVGVHNTARGQFDAAVGGQDNEAAGLGDAVIGGEENIAEGQYSVTAGGYRNEAAGFYDVVSGGAMNVATGNFAVVAGGQNNFAQGSAASVSGGRGNEAVGKLTSINGGAGNKASGAHSTVVGGVGVETPKEGAAMWHDLDTQDRKEVASKDFSKSNHGGAVWTSTLDESYRD